MWFRTEIKPLNSYKHTGNVLHVCHQLSCTSAANKQAGLLRKGARIKPISPEFSRLGDEMRNRSEGEQEHNHLLISSSPHRVPSHHHTWTHKSPPKSYYLEKNHFILQGETIRLTRSAVATPVHTDANAAP